MLRACRYLLWFISVVTLAAGITKTSVAQPSTPAQMAQRVDRLLEDRMLALGWKPSKPCDDASFLRRASLDLVGLAPAASEVQQFLQDTSPDKRAQLTDRLLQSPLHAAHLANVWSAWLLPESTSPENLLGRNSLHSWLRGRFAENLRYDRLVADLLVANGSVNDGPAAFFVSLEGKPEKIAAKTSRVFLGLQLDCAECHDHPFDRWKQREFWGFAAYFAQVTTQPSRINPGNAEISDVQSGEVRLPNSEEIISPAALVNTGFSSLQSGTRRQQLTLWLTARENPYLARAAVNRVWALMFGRGLIEPIDDMRNLEMATHPQLLVELSDYFTGSGFDLRLLIDTLARTQAYHRSTDHPQGVAPEDSYATMKVKPLSAIQLATCLSQVARNHGTTQGSALAAQLAADLGRLRGEGSEATLGIVQALVTMHSNVMSQVWTEIQSRLLQAVSAPHIQPQQQIQWIFLATLNRLPTEQELKSLSKFASKSANDHPSKKATEPPTDQSDQLAEQSKPIATWQADLLWALINSTEFAMTP